MLITIDTLRADYVGCYGSEFSRTPTLDGLARSGVRFETVIAPTPMTRPSHASIMTGLEPTLHGVHDNAKFRLEEDIPTLAEQFQGAGFETAAFVATLVLDRGSGLDQGFDSYDDRMDYPPSPGDPGSLAERSAGRVVDAALEWLEDAPDSFFLWVHLYDPHADYRPPPAYAATQEREFALDELGFLRALASYLPPDYAGEVSFSDAQLGRLLRTIDRRWDRSDPQERVLLESLGYVSRSSEKMTQELGWVGGPDAKERLPAIIALTEANWHLDRHRPARALAALEASPPAGGWIALARSRAALALERPTEAKRLAKEMIANQPDYPEGFVALGEALEAMGRTREAGDAFREAERLSPAPLDSILGLGRVAEAEGDLESAKRFYRKIFESSIPSADAALRLAALYFDEGQSDQAQALLEELGGAPGERPTAIIRLARAQTAAGFWREALVRLKSSIQQGAGAPTVRTTFRDLRDAAREAGLIESGRAAWPAGSARSARPIPPVQPR